MSDEPQHRIICIGHLCDRHDMDPDADSPGPCDSHALEVERLSAELAKAQAVIAERDHRIADMADRWKRQVVELETENKDLLARISPEVELAKARELTTELLRENIDYEQKNTMLTIEVEKLRKRLEALRPAGKEEGR